MKEEINESQNEYYIVRIKKRKIHRIGVILAVLISIVFVYVVLHSYRYERFKDGHKYMRYDKWKEQYEKYDIPKKQWEPI